MLSSSDLLAWERKHMDLRIALGIINERAVNNLDKKLEQASLIVRKIIEDADAEQQACHREISRQRRSLERILKISKDPTQDSMGEILNEVKETLGLNLPRNPF
jgi:hypothetical protein